MAKFSICKKTIWFKTYNVVYEEYMDYKYDPYALDGLCERIFLKPVTLNKLTEVETFYKNRVIDYKHFPIYGTFIIDKGLKNENS